MAMLEPNFVYGVIRKSLILGGVGAIVGYLVASGAFAAAVAIGALVTAINLRTVAWAIKKMFESGRDGNASAVGWSLLLGLKMMLLIALVWVLLAYVNVNAVGFAIGLSLFMPAIGWQLLTSGPERRDSEEG